MLSGTALEKAAAAMLGELYRGCLVVHVVGKSDPGFEPPLIGGPADSDSVNSRRIS